jgi:hypothetical protein
MSFDLTSTIELSQASKELFNKFVSDNAEKKETSYVEVFSLISRAGAAFTSLTSIKGKLLNVNHQRQLLKILFTTLVENVNNDFTTDPRIDEIIEIVLKLRDGEFNIDLGGKGMGCLPCLSSCKISAKR